MNLTDSGSRAGNAIKKIMDECIKKVDNSNLDISEKIIYDLYGLVSNKKLNFEFVKLINSVMNIEIVYKSGIYSHTYEMYCEGLKIAECTCEMKFENDGSNYSCVFESDGIKTTLEYEVNKDKYTMFSDYSYKDLYRYKKGVDNMFK